MTGEVELALPLVNIASGTKEFIADPHSQYRALQRIKDASLNLLAIYHSHPGGGVDPSAADVAYARRWSCAHVIVALRETGNGEHRMRAFRIDQQGGAQDVSVEVCGHEADGQS